MRSASVTVKIPQALWDHREALLKSTGAKSVNAMFVGWWRYAMLHGKENTFTNAIAELSLSSQDEADDGIIIKFESGETLFGTYLEHMIDESVEKYAKGVNVPKEKVVENGIEKLRDAGRKARKS